MTAKEYLQQYLNADRDIDAKLDQIHRFHELAMKTTASLGDERVQTSTENKTEKIVAKIVDLQNEVNAEIDSLGDIKKQVQNVIRRVPDASQRAVLERRYINGDTWEQIAVEMNYTYRNVCYIHGKALCVVANNIS